MKKLNVGADASVRPITQNGITLIALIITIIVMLILVGVTINVALNGGLFDKAKTAQEQTQRETDKEQLLSAVIGTLNDDGTVNEAELQAHLPDNFKYENGVYKNKVTGKEYTVDTETGKITEVTNSNSGNSENTEPAEGTYSFTLGDIAEKNMEGTLDQFVALGNNLLTSSAIENLKDSITLNTNSDLDQDVYYFNNVVCSDSSLTNVSSQEIPTDSASDCYWLCCSEGCEYIILKVVINGVLFDSFTDYSSITGLTFTITK